MPKTKSKSKPPRALDPETGLGAEIRTLIVQASDCARASEAAQRQATTAAIEAGRKLLDAKAKLAAHYGGSSHGHWKNWIKMYFGRSYETAALYMRLAKRTEVLDGLDGTDALEIAAGKPLRETLEFMDQKIEQKLSHGVNLDALAEQIHEHLHAVAEILDRVAHAYDYKLISRWRKGEHAIAERKIMELDYWAASPRVGARWDETRREWEVAVDRPEGRLLLRPKQLIFATGSYGPPHAPKVDGAETFAGELYHSSRYVGGEKYRGKRSVVVGAASSGHDVCADLCEHGAQVTMIQRRPTTAVKSETLMELGFKGLYSEEALAKGVTTEKADLLFASIPFRLMPALQIPLYERIAAQDADLYARLAQAGSPRTSSPRARLRFAAASSCARSRSARSS
jgi:hypothetical protein